MTIIHFFFVGSSRLVAWEEVVFTVRSSSGVAAVSSSQ
jgi:hypothetical protein